MCILDFTIWRVRLNHQSLNWYTPHNIKIFSSFQRATINPCLAVAINLGNEILENKKEIKQRMNMWLSPMYKLLNERSLSRSSALSVKEWTTPAQNLCKKQQWHVQNPVQSEIKILCKFLIIKEKGNNWKERRKMKSIYKLYLELYSLIVKLCWIFLVYALVVVSFLLSAKRKRYIKFMPV